MKYRNCPVCKEKIEYDSVICKHCMKGVFVFDFREEKNTSINIDRFQINYGEICGWHEVFPKEVNPKPPREWVCFKREPQVFIAE